MEAQLSLLKKETQEYTYSCAAEAKKMVEEVQMEAHNLDIVEREAAEVLKVFPHLLLGQTVKALLCENDF